MRKSGQDHAGIKDRPDGPAAAEGSWKEASLWKDERIKALQIEGIERKEASAAARAELASSSRRCEAPPKRRRAGRTRWAIRAGLSLR